MAENPVMRRKRALLIYNPASGKAKDSSVSLDEIVYRMNEWKLVPETYILEPDSDVKKQAEDALKRGIRMIIACGGDGTVSAVSKAVSGMPVTLGIIPSGTQNNIAYSLSIPFDIPESIALLRTGKRTRIDCGQLTIGNDQLSFLEICSLGLTSSIFPSADGIQHGHFEKIGDFLAKLITFSPSEVMIRLDGKESFTGTGQAVLIANMPYAGCHQRLGNGRAFQDGLLDILFFGNLPKRELIGYVLNKFGKKCMDDPRIHHFQARSVDIDAIPSMPVMADGNMLGNGSVHAEVKRKTLGVMTNGQ